LDKVPGDQLTELQGRMIFRDLNNLILRALGDQMGVPCEDDTTLPAAEIDEFEKALPLEIEGVIPQEPKVLGELPQHSVNKELHKGEKTLLSPSAQRTTGTKSSFSL
jgi:hypothetical protein